MATTYFFCAVFGCILVVIDFLLMLMGVGSDAIDADVDVADTSGDGAFEDASDGGSHFLRALSLRSLSAAVAFFGLGGRGAQELGASEPVALVIALVCGSFAMWLVYILMKSLTRFNQNGAIVAGTEINAEGVVNLRVPANRAGMGKVEIVQQGRTMEYDALTDDPDELTSGTPIIVVRAITPSQMRVTKRL